MSCSIVDRHRCQWQAWEIAVLVFAKRHYYKYAHHHLNRTRAACAVKISTISCYGYDVVSKSAVNRELQSIKAIASALGSDDTAFIIKEYVTAKKLDKLLKAVELLGYTTVMVQEVGSSGKSAKKMPLWVENKA